MNYAIHLFYPESLTVRRKRPAFTLIEVVIAVTVMGVAALTFILSLVYSHKISTATAFHMSASQFLQGEIERIRADEYDLIQQARYPDRTVAAGNPVFLDAEQRVPLTVNYDVLSTFSVVSGSRSSVRLGNIPTNALRNGELAVDELTSNIVVIARGRGLTQRGLVRSNTHDTITITADTTGASDRSWDFAPNSSSIIQLNMGKVVTVRANWVMSGRLYSEEMRTLVVLPLDL